MDINDDFRLEEELFGSEGGKNLRGSGVVTHCRKLRQNKPGRDEGNLP